MDRESECYILTTIHEGEQSIYSLRDDGPPRVLMFETYDDADRYAIMLEQDEGYIVGETLTMEVAEVNLGDAIDVLNDKGQDYLFVRKDDLFIPPPLEY